MLTARQKKCFFPSIFKMLYSPWTYYTAANPDAECTLSWKPQMELCDTTLISFLDEHLRCFIWLTGNMFSNWTTIMPSKLNCLWRVSKISIEVRLLSRAGYKKHMSPSFHITSVSLATYRLWVQFKVSFNTTV